MKHASHASLDRLASLLEQLREKARLLRIHSLRMTTAAGSGHPTSSLSGVEVAVALYFGGVMRYDPKNPTWPQRDRFILSKGHGCITLYVLLQEKGFFPEEELRKFCRFDGILARRN